MVNGGCWVCRLQSVLMEMARGQLTQCCLSIEHTKLDKQMMEQSDRTLFHRNRVKTVTADTGGEPKSSDQSLSDVGPKKPMALEKAGISDLVSGFHELRYLLLQ